MNDQVEDVQSHLNAHGINVKDFYQYINFKKKKILSIQNFIDITAPFPEDPAKDKMNKIVRIFSFKFLRE
jgi:hypothetical protein